MPKVTEAYLEERRQQILDAAINCIARKGLHKTTMEDIGQEAGLSHTVAYRYYDGKDDILVASVQRSVERSARFFDAMADEEDTFVVFQRMINDFFLRLEEPGRDIYYRFRVQLWAESIQNPEVAKRLLLVRGEGQMQLARLVEKGQERGQINPSLDAQATAAALMANVDGFILHWIAQPNTDIWRYRDAVMAMIGGLFNHRE